MAQQVGKAPAVEQRRTTWVQTERAAHEAWVELMKKAPMAARLAHVLVAHMDGASNALVASQTTLGELMGGVHRNTVRRAIDVLEAERWIEVVQLGGKGGALAYVVNSRVAWGRSRADMRYAKFSASVLASGAEQLSALDDRPPLRQVPVLMAGEQQLPSGPGAAPPSQPSIGGMEPDLPSLQRDPNTVDWVDGKPDSERP